MDRTEALNQAVDALLAGLPATAESEALTELRPLLDEGRALLRHRPMPGAARATFMLGLEAQLLTDLRLRAPMGRVGSRLPARLVGLIGLVLVGAALLFQARAALPGSLTAPFAGAWEAVAVAVAPGQEARVRELLAQGWRYLGVAEAVVRSPVALAARERALRASVERYQLALAAASRPELDERLRHHAAAEVHLVMTRLARQAHGRPLAERAIWTGARRALGRLLLADTRVVHFPASPRTAPLDMVQLLPPPTTTAVPAMASTELPTESPTEVPPATAQPTPEAWPTLSGVPPVATPLPSSEPGGPATPAPATARPARPPATATNVPAGPTAPPARAATPTQDRWPTATPQGGDPAPTTNIPPQPSAPPPSEPPPLAP